MAHLRLLWEKIISEVKFGWRSPFQLQMQSVRTRRRTWTNLRRLDWKRYVEFARFERLRIVDVEPLSQDVVAWRKHPVRSPTQSQMPIPNFEC